MTNSHTSSSTSGISTRQSEPCHCGRATGIVLAWTDANPGRRFYRCDLHGFVSWADEEKPGGWQKQRLLEARDQIQRYRDEINRLTISEREAREQLVLERSTRQPNEDGSQMVDQVIFQQELLKREKILRTMFTMSWGGFIVLTATIIYMLKK